jgi:hypothetical protein
MPAKLKRDENMSTVPLKQKSPMDSLVQSFAEVIESGASKMNEIERRESEKKFNDAVDRAVAGRKQPREKA